MKKLVSINEPVRMLVRTLPSGKIVPTSFIWRDQTRYVADVGRQWEERVDGKSIHCFLVQAVDQNTYEVRWDPAGEVWILQRAWLMHLV